MQLVVPLPAYAARLLVAIPMQYAATVLVCVTIPLQYVAIVLCVATLAPQSIHVADQPLEAAQATTLFAHVLSAQVAQALVATQLDLAVALAFALIVVARVVQPVATQAALQVLLVPIVVVASVVEAALVAAVVASVAEVDPAAEAGVLVRDNV